MAMPMDTDKRVAPPILLVCCFELKNLRRHMCYREIKNKKYRQRHMFISVHWLGHFVPQCANRSTLINSFALLS